MISYTIPFKRTKKALGSYTVDTHHIFNLNGGRDNMPYWLQRQLRRAFLGKDERQIRILNDCWYLYQRTLKPEYEEERSKENS
jgi:hypothetical protein